MFNYWFGAQKWAHLNRKVRSTNLIYNYIGITELDARRQCVPCATIFSEWKDESPCNGAEDIELLGILRQNEPHRDKTNKMLCAPSEDSDQPGHPLSLIRVFTVRSVGFVWCVMPFKLNKTEGFPEYAFLHQEEDLFKHENNSSSISLALTG